MRTRRLIGGWMSDLNLGSGYACSRKIIMKITQIILVVIIANAAITSAQSNPIVIENAHVRYTISPEGKNLGFMDRAAGIDYLQRNAPSTCAIVRLQGKEYPATFVSYDNERLVLRFGKAQVEAVLRVERRNSYIRLTVESVSGGEIESLIF
jgi:hypothetical protein